MTRWSVCIRVTMVEPSVTVCTNICAITFRDQPHTTVTRLDRLRTLKNQQTHTYTYIYIHIHTNYWLIT